MRPRDFGDYVGAQAGVILNGRSIFNSKPCAERGAYHQNRASACYRPSSDSLNMYLIDDLYSRTLGWPPRFSLIQVRSYHSMTPRTSSPSLSTTTIGVRDCICF